MNYIHYRTLTVYVLFKNMLLRMLGAAIASYSLYHVKENPVVCSVIVLLFFIPVLILGDDELIVYKSEVKYRCDSILSIARIKKVIKLADIKSFTVEGEFGLLTDLITDVSPKSLYEPFNYIHITLNDNTVINIPTKIYISKLKKAEKIVTSKLKATSTTMV